MKHQTFISICCLLLIGRTLAAPPEDVEQDFEQDEHHENDVYSSNRDEKFLFFIKILPEQCNTGIDATPIGTCMDYKGCRKAGGTATTRCAKGLGTCCLASKTCGQTTSSNITYFVSPNFPEPYTSGGRCQLTVNRANNNICQVRIDFLSFNLAQPTTEDGECSTDFMTVTGGISNNVPVLCGYNTGQHIYVNVDPQGSPLKILVDASDNDDTSRIFNMQITQIPCNSRSLAPSGCLQYYTGTSGTVQSFNFPIQPETVVRNRVTRQLADTEYTICVRPESGYCTISWSPDSSVDPFSFFVTGDANVLDESLFGNIQAAEVENCTTDYVIVPGGEFTGPMGAESASDRYCGAAFPDPVTSSLQPFQLFVKTDSSEAPFDVGNFGFSLSFRQNIC